MDALLGGPGAEDLSRTLAAHLVPKLRLRDVPALLGSCRCLQQLVTQGAGQLARATLKPTSKGLS